MAKPIDPMRFPPHYESLLRELAERPEPTQIEFASEGEAKAFRFDWYAWIKAHSRLIVDPVTAPPGSLEIVNLARPIVLSFKAPNAIVFSNRLTGRFAQALERQGVMITPPPFRMPGDQANQQSVHFESNPMAAFEEMMTKHGYVGAKKPEDKS